MSDEKKPGPMRGCLKVLGCLSAVGLGAAVALVAVIHIAGIVWNAGPMNLPDTLGPSVVVTARELNDDSIRPDSAPRVLNAALTRCQPSSNGLRVWFNELWYNAITDGYDLRLWVEEKPHGRSEFALYIWGNHAYQRTLRSPYKNRLLVCDLTPTDWKELL